MPKYYNNASRNAQSYGGFLSELPKGDCIQLTNNGMTKTEGLFSFESPAMDAAPADPNYQHRPRYGQLSGRQPSGDKE
jgi:hypothetical protein